MEHKKVLVIGSGGREHALCWKLAMSPRVSRVYCAPGNAGIARHAHLVPIAATDISRLMDWARAEEVDLTVVGPEAPLAAGIVDEFRTAGLRIFGPTKAAAELEASKVFAKNLLLKAGIPTGGFRVAEDMDAALECIREIGIPVVLKADGLAAGKGVIVAKSYAEAEDAARLILETKSFGDAGRRLVIEEYLDGEEASFMAITDGRTVLPLATSQDHKAVFDGDRGPNTGGMGAYSPAPVVTARLFEEVLETIIKPTVSAMEGEGRPYQGVLYAGLMIKEGRAKVLEYNCRFGDPEAQPILMRMKGDLAKVLDDAVDGRLHEVALDWDPRPAVCVVLASGGYPGAYETGKVIRGLDETEGAEDVMVFHAGTSRADGHLVTAGGRVLGVTAMGNTIQEAIERAYKATERISWEGMHFRRDIGRKAIGRDLSSARPDTGPCVGILMGSPSDREIMQETKKILEKFHVPCEMIVASAHRSPELAMTYARTARSRGIRVIIAGAGMAAHLAGAIAAHSTLPVIGVPVASSPLNGMDALLSTVQMPPGIPVATMAIGKAGAKNAAMFAIQILALTDPALAQRIDEFRRSQAQEIERMNQEGHED